MEHLTLVTPFHLMPPPVMHQNLVLRWNPGDSGTIQPVLLIKGHFQKTDIAHFRKGIINFT